jgi:hypothetical protein
VPSTAVPSTTVPSTAVPSTAGSPCNEGVGALRLPGGTAGLLGKAGPRGAGSLAGSLTIWLRGCRGSRLGRCPALQHTHSRHCWLVSRPPDWANRLVSTNQYLPAAVQLAVAMLQHDCGRCGSTTIECQRSAAVPPHRCAASRPCAVVSTHSTAASVVSTHSTAAR